MEAASYTLLKESSANVVFIYSTVHQINEMAFTDFDKQLLDAVTK